ncbi:LPS export ABC transporter periplasmic protein LptC [Pontibacter beigongshangensis]|uniref:LPS export ABC transporter periplasmic protein LptC n=1 Tax=Pontibacter beigongshangensis TaxID=2574733 RepID=UPI0016500231|nr:LPS export ABC transporter periplasmic protein LptC [Pontibacter beigongshangensis]
MLKAWILGVLAVLVVVSTACDKDLKDPDKEIKYTGPLIENNNVLTLFSDSARLLIKMKAPVQQEFENGDAIFPKGVYIEFYDEPGVMTSTLRSNYGKQDRNKNLYHVTGNVVVENLQKKEKIETEELFWDKNRDKIYTDKFVKITTDSEVITGYGLRTNQKFSPWVMTKVTGSFALEKE